jgi:hypothetical protein
MHGGCLLQELLETQHYHRCPAVLSPLKALKTEFLHCSLLSPEENDLIQLQFNVVGRVL